MKKSILLLFILLALSLYSQEKQNDATWKETVDFISEYVATMNTGMELFYPDFGNTFIEQFEYRVEDDNLIVNHKGKDFNVNYSIDMKYLKKGYYMNGAFNLISIPKKGIMEDIRKGTTRWVGINLGIHDCISKVMSSENKLIKCKRPLTGQRKQYYNRLVKAFNHIIYLANEKRKKSKF